MRSKNFRVLAFGVAIVAAIAAHGFAQPTDYVVGPQDVLAITVFGSNNNSASNITGKYTVEPDGTFTFSWVGRVAASGKTSRDIEVELKRLLADGYYRNPQVSVTVEQYRSQQIFVVGEARSPGAYPMTGDMTLIEALARAGSITPAGSGEALIVHSKAGRAGPVLPGQDKEAEVIRVDVKALQSGQLSENYTLRDGDTIFLPAAEIIYVSGNVKTPGAFPIKPGTTVVQALSLAGGVTDRGSPSRVQVSRMVGGRKKEVRVRPDDVVQAGDTLVVLGRIF